jgi:hypothetical protein
MNHSPDLEQKQKWVAEQVKLREKLITEYTEDLTAEEADVAPSKKLVRYIGGVEISFVKGCL